MEEQYIPYSTRSEVGKINVGDVLFIEQDQRKLFVCTEEKIYCFYCKLDEVMAYLDESFYRCHKSYVVNMDKISFMKEQTVVFYNGQTIVLGANSFRRTKQCYSRHIQQRALKNKELPDS